MVAGDKMQLEESGLLPKEWQELLTGLLRLGSLSKCRALGKQKSKGSEEVPKRVPPTEFTFCGHIVIP